MKKLFLLVIVAVASIANAQVGNFKIGGNVGVPVGNLSNVSNFVIGVDAAYMFNVLDNLELGVATGYQHYFAKDIKGFDSKLEDGKMIPLAASLKVNATPQFFVAGDVGAIFSIGNDDGESAFYYAPRVGYQFEKNEVTLGYRGFSKYGIGVGAISLGYAYNF
ncbi:outer membrane beta-barrel protein [Ornithobacterium rhinotracheale]|uniref:outer membrane beta-barrel protein n=1 Tax=Ornithobacterium rhinotracheale TaxID=28251 RepID=UPI004037134D